MIKVAIAGTNGLAQYIANFIDTTTSHQFVILSRRPNPGLTAKGWQVLQADYSNSDNLRFQLTGVDTVISTISGSAQIALIDAAAAVQVRRFVPAEFGCTPSKRSGEDLLDDSRRSALVALLQHERNGMRFTVFTCGVFYERFAPGGMSASQIGLRSNIGQEGEYILDVRRSRAQVPIYNAAATQSYVCMTSARDVARAIVVALSFTAWPREFKLHGDRLSSQEIVTIAEELRGREFEKTYHTCDTLQDAITVARAIRDRRKEIQLHHLRVTAEGRYDHDDANMNLLLPFAPESFRTWLTRNWSPVLWPTITV